MIPKNIVAQSRATNAAPTRAPELGLLPPASVVTAMWAVSQRRALGSERNSAHRKARTCKGGAL